MHILDVERAYLTIRLVYFSLCVESSSLIECGLVLCLRLLKVRVTEQYRPYPVYKLHRSNEVGYYFYVVLINTMIYMVGLSLSLWTKR